MLRVLTFDEPRLVRLLRTGYFRSLGLRIITACAPDALLERALFLAPDVVLVMADRIPPGYARALRACLGERRTQMVLVVREGGAALDDDLTMYDGVIALAEPELELARLLSAHLSRSQRRQARRRVRLPVQLTGGGAPALDGVALDLSSDGAGLLVGSMPSHAAPQTARFHRGDGRSVSASARVVWADARTDPAVRIGLRLLDMSRESAGALADLALWELRLDGGVPIVHLHGELDEQAILSTLVEHLGEEPIVDLGDVVRANSAGLLRWSTFLRQLPSEKTVRLRRVPATVMRQFMLIPLATLGCTIESYFAPYECEACEADVELLLYARDERSAQPCPLCREPMSSSVPALQLGGVA